MARSTRSGKSRRIGDDPFGSAKSKKTAGGASGAAAAPAAKTIVDPYLGQEVGRCKLEARIGVGKTSIVYRATHTTLDKQVAVKILQPAVLQYPDVVAKFDEEARAVARLDHENI